MSCYSRSGWTTQMDEWPKYAPPPHTRCITAEARSTKGNRERTQRAEQRLTCRLQMTTFITLDILPSPVPGSRGCSENVGRLSRWLQKITPII